jgi:hypothetical protein
MDPAVAAVTVPGARQRERGSTRALARALWARLRRWSSGVLAVDLLAVVTLVLTIFTCVGLGLAITRDYSVRPPRVLSACPSSLGAAGRLPVGRECLTVQVENPNPAAPDWSPARHGRGRLPCTVAAGTVCTLVGPVLRRDLP